VVDEEMARRELIQEEGVQQQPSVMFGVAFQ
jgi:hypothetical protein